jgi:hypothetical protein
MVAARVPEARGRGSPDLFWEEQTEVEIARMRSLSQQAISKQKRRILEQLLNWMGRSKKGGHQTIAAVKRSPQCILTIGGGGLRAVPHHPRQPFSSRQDPIRVFDSTDRLKERIGGSWVRRRPRKKICA